MRAFTERSVVGTLFKTQTRPTHNFTETFVIYWAIQAGLLTPLNFARHRLSPLAFLLPVRTFFSREAVTVNLRILHCQR